MSHRLPKRGRRSIGTAAAALCVLAGAITVGAAVADRSSPPPTPVTAGRAPMPPRPGDRPSAPLSAMPRSTPVAVKIPAIDLNVRLVAVKLSSSGEMPLPDDPTRASWLASSPTPGERGTSIIAGHVDTADGPAAFYNLSAAKLGMPVNITRHDGTTAHFTVDAVAVYPKNDFPDTRAYGPTPGPSLRLITCTGWNPDTREYLENAVIYASTHPAPANH